MLPQKKIEYYCSNRFKTMRPKAPNGREYHVKCASLTQAKLVGLLKAAIGLIDDTSRRLIAFTTLDSDQYFHLYREGITIRNHCLPDYFTVGLHEAMVPDDNVDQQLAYLESINAVNRLALNKVLKGEPVTNTTLMLLDPVIGGSAPTNNRHNISAVYAVSMIEAVSCEKCKIVKEKDYMLKHKLHPECLVESDRARMQETGMVKVEDINNAIAVRAAGIQHEMVSEFYAVYAPAWVADAIKIYHQNENYAGMNLDEFLKSMKPDAKR